MKYFTIAELCKSAKATAHGIENKPNSVESANLTLLIDKMLDPIREQFGSPIKVNSGFRCKALNSITPGASNTSSHVYGLAADIVPANGNMKKLQEEVLEWATKNKFDQIIIEKPTNGIASWIHVGVKHGRTGEQRKQILVANKINGEWVYSKFKVQSS